MFGKKPPVKFGHEPNISTAKAKDALPEVALAAILSYKKQKEIGDFMSFFLGALERNSDWLNGVVGRQTNFRCALMVGAGPNRFHLQEVIYPNDENDVRLEVEHRDSEDFDKVAIAAIMNLTNHEIDHLLKYIKTRLNENPMREEFIKGKELGINFAVLRPFSENQYRLVERIVIGSSMKCIVPQTPKKRRWDEKAMTRAPLKRAKRVA
ncbi:jg19832 [Pararge aegeria aegeria]|uniref:Jg19832 protein n=1 Tax=Pararge aegeria aegeria TaxID=348720 RepID=A0A8S4SFE7_9NEOP|nr:jg19832 [Pararge aegeria aegeria]